MKADKEDDYEIERYNRKIVNAKLCVVLMKNMLYFEMKILIYDQSNENYDNFL